MKMIKLWTIKFYNTGPWAGCAGQYSVNLTQMPEVDTPRCRKTEKWNLQISTEVHF